MSISTLTLLQFSQWGIAFIAVSAMLLILWRKTLLVKPFTEAFMPLDRTAIQSHAKLNVGLNWILGFAYICLFMFATAVFDLPFEKSAASVFIPFIVLCIPIFIFAKMRMKRDVPLEYPGMSNLWNFIALREKSIEKAHLVVGGDGSADTLGDVLSALQLILEGGQSSNTTISKASSTRGLKNSSSLPITLTKMFKNRQEKRFSNCHGLIV